MSNTRDVMYDYWKQDANAVVAMQEMCELSVARAARGYGQLDEYLAIAYVPDETSTSTLWQARELFLGVLHDFERLERAARGRCGDAFDEWLDEMLEKVRENEMVGRWDGHWDGHVGYHECRRRARR